MLNLNKDPGVMTQQEEDAAGDYCAKTVVRERLSCDRRSALVLSFLITFYSSVIGAGVANACGLPAKPPVNLPFRIDGIAGFIVAAVRRALRGGKKDDAQMSLLVQHFPEQTRSAIINEINSTEDMHEKKAGLRFLVYWFAEYQYADYDTLKSTFGILNEDSEEELELEDAA